LISVGGAIKPVNTRKDNLKTLIAADPVCSVVRGLLNVLKNGAHLDDESNSQKSDL